MRCCDYNYNKLLCYIRYKQKYGFEDDSSNQDSSPLIRVDDDDQIFTDRIKSNT